MKKTKAELEKELEKLKEQKETKSTYTPKTMFRELMMRAYKAGYLLGFSHWTGDTITLTLDADVDDCFDD